MSKKPVAVVPLAGKAPIYSGKVPTTVQVARLPPVAAGLGGPLLPLPVKSVLRLRYYPLPENNALHIYS
ncbi:hypothetical protein [Kaarinaea lacus]